MSARVIARAPAMPDSSTVLACSIVAVRPSVATASAVTGSEPSAASGIGTESEAAVAP